MAATEQPLTVFYTDDDTDDQALFREVLEELGAPHRLYVQGHGGELLEALRNPPPEPSIIFLDLNMPVKNGFDVLKEIRQSEEYKSTPVVIFTTSSDQSNVSKARDLGATMFVTKPGSYGSYKKAVQDLLEKDWRHADPDNSNFQYRVS